MMPLISSIEYCGLDLNHKHGLVIHVRGDTPPGAARSGAHSARRRFWEQGKRLPQGGLVAIVTKERSQAATVSLALLTTCKFYRERNTHPQSLPISSTSIARVPPRLTSA